MTKAEAYDGGVRAQLSDGSSVEVDTVLVAAGRQPNSDGLDLDRTGVEVDDHGIVVVDRHQRTGVEGIWALGDIANHFQLKHVSNLEARVIQHNLLHPDDLWESRHDVVPSAVFSNPQVASVGLTERQAAEQGVRHVVAQQRYGDTAYGWAMEDTTGFAKLVADPDTGLILGAHFLGAAGLEPDPAPGAGDELRADRARRRPRPVLDPPGADGGRGEPAPRPARAAR